MSALRAIREARMDAVIATERAALESDLRMCSVGAHWCRHTDGCDKSLMARVENLAETLLAKAVNP